jgi:glycosyltransferase involved in cell wall biosynthesis
MVATPSISVLTSVYEGEKYLPAFFENLLSQTIFPEIQLVLVLNQPNSQEKRLVNDFQARNVDKVDVLSVKRETLGASWNRGWQEARAPYIAIWNVDDRRTVDSLQRQLNSLEANANSVLCYGDYVSVDEYGKENGTRRNTPLYRAGHFSRSFAQGGAFWLARRTLGAIVGPFDEQFRVGADMDFSFRIAAKGLAMNRCDGILGYFTDASTGLSTRGGAQDSAIERTAIQLRYGVYDKVRPELMETAKQFRIDSILYNGEWLSLDKYLPGHFRRIQKKNYLWQVGKLRAWARTLLQRTGLLQVVYSLQKKLLKREI